MKMPPMEMPPMEDDLQGIQPPLEDDLCWKTTFKIQMTSNEIWTPIEEDIKIKTTSN